MLDVVVVVVFEDCGCVFSLIECCVFDKVGVSCCGVFGIGVFSVVVFSVFGIFNGVFVVYVVLYLSWDDVQCVKNSEVVKVVEVSCIEGLIQLLICKVVEMQVVVKVVFDEFYEVQQSYFVVVIEVDIFQVKVDEQVVKVDEFVCKVGQVVVQLYCNGGDDILLEFFFVGFLDNVDELFVCFGMMDKFFEYNQLVYDDVVVVCNFVQLFSDQVIVVCDECDWLQKIVEEKMVVVQQVVDVVQVVFDEQFVNFVIMQVQFVVFKDNIVKIVVGYQVGVEVVEKVCWECEVCEVVVVVVGNGGGGGGGGGSQGSGGWCCFYGGGKSFGYGFCFQQCGLQGCLLSFYYGIDFVNGCGVVIYVVQFGIVDYVGGNGGYGNYICIQYGGGIGIGYVYICDGGIFVCFGQWVQLGQVIVYVGNIGCLFGCYFYFEVYVNGGVVNLVQFFVQCGVFV